MDIADSKTFDLHWRMKLNSRMTYFTLTSPHIPLASSLAEALKILNALGVPVVEVMDNEHSFRADTEHFNIAIYPDGDTIKSVWYNDALGRESEEARGQKIERYLERYGALSNWKMTMDNGWMQYWFNERDGATMVYGVHMDVIRFNRYDPDPSE
jgi:hypothetical protein